MLIGLSYKKVFTFARAEIFPFGCVIPYNFDLQSKLKNLVTIADPNATIEEETNGDNRLALCNFAMECL